MMRYIKAFCYFYQPVLFWTMLLAQALDVTVSHVMAHVSFLKFGNNVWLHIPE